jgi:D-glycero-alpha-D-manno-heptose-7-phosphate kinase
VRELPKYFDYKYRIRYYEPQHANAVDQITEPSVREAIKLSGITVPLDLTHHGDLPGRSGIGSSSSFSVSLIHALHTLDGRMTTKRQLALAAINLEQNVLKQSVGSQDQVAAAFGGINHIKFNSKTTFFIAPFNSETLTCKFKFASLSF